MLASSEKQARQQCQKKSEKHRWSWALGLMPIILATLEVKIRRIMG
jgi:hypothetical protein